MNGYLTFEGRIEPLVWGDSTYTIPPLPAPIADSLAAQGAPGTVEVPDDIRRALLFGGVLAAWEALTPGTRRGRLHQIATAKRDDTRAKRITALIRDLERDA